MMRRILTLTIVAVLAASALAACGRKAAPEYPPGTTYPAPYPK